MKSASRLLSVVSLALAAGMMVSCAHTETVSDFPSQSEIQARQISASHVLNTHCCAPAPSPSKVDIVINFDTASDKLTPAGAAAVEKVAAIIGSPSFQGSHVTIEGFTDSKGKASKNVKLSYRRALTVMHTLVEHYGIPAGMLSAQGFGAANPVATNSTTTGRAANRRVTFSVSGMR